MTDRAQPGAIDSVVRNDELAQVFEQANAPWIVPGDEPTTAAQRRGTIDESALDAFDLTFGDDSLTVTVAPGEAFVGGWCVRDEPTEISLEAGAQHQIVVGWSTDAIYDPDTDADQDDADETIVTTAADADPLHPTTVAWVVETDSDGVVAAERATPVGNEAGGADAGAILAYQYMGV